MTSRKMLVIALLLSCVALTWASPALAAKKGERIEAYIASVNKIIDRETKSGKAVPAYSNTAKLPLMVFPKAIEGTERAEFRIDVSGVKKLYIGTGERVTFRGVTLDSGDGVKQKLREKSGKTLVKVAASDKRRFRWNRGGGDFYLQQCETSLQLDGKYKWISGKLDAQRGVTWMSVTSNVSKLHTWSRMRGSRQSAAQRAGFDRRKDTPMMASGFVRLTIADAVGAVTDYTMQRYGRKNQVDPAIIAAIQKAAKTAKTGADYDDVRSLCFAAINYREFDSLRKRVKETQDFPGLSKKFDSTIAKDYALLNPAKFDYSTDFAKQQKAWDNLLKEVKTINAYPALITETIKQFSQTAPPEAELAKQQAARQARLTAAANDVDKYLAVYAELKAERLKFLSGQAAMNFDSILINRTPPPGYSHNGDQHLGRHSRLSKGLTILTDWKSGNPKVKTILEGKMPPGSYRNPDLSYDGKRVLFAFCDHTEEDKKLRRFFIWEAAIDGSWVRQLTGTKRDKFQTWDNRATVLIEDNDPCYLPDGGILFISSRCQSFGRCHGGRYNPAWNLHRCDKDGNNIQQLSFANENEVEPSVLNDGRIVFTRWEYTNRHEMWFHKLWWCRPDGTGVAHFFGNDMIVPHQFLEASAIPGTHKVVCTGQGHHSYNTGTTVVLDTNIGENGEEAVTHITPETPYSETKGWPNPHYSHPYAITENLFLISRANHPVHNQGRFPPKANRAIYLVDSFGGRDKIYEDPEIASFSPIAIRPRKAPPILPSHLPAKAEPYGIVALQNAYLTRKENDPNGIIKPGMIKALRVNALGVQPRASRVSCTPLVPNDIPKKVLGTVPINEDGSAVFRVPANVSLQVQTLDENGMAILTEKSLFYMMPGERRSCVGCHEAVGTTPPMKTVAKMSRMKPVDLSPPAGPKYRGGMSFARTVQPVLDRYCIKCHGLEKTEKKVSLIYAKSGRYPDSLMEIVKRGDHRIGDKGFSGGRYKGTNVTYNISHPRVFFAYSNSVAQKLAKGDKHHKSLKDVDRESYMRIIEWLDLNGQCYGDLFPNRIEDRKIDETALKELRTFIRVMLDEKLATQPAAALINVSQPSESRILKMPMPKIFGGWGQIKGYDGPSDLKHQKAVELVNACIKKNPNENVNGWEPTWDMGGAENWVKEARANYIEKINKK